MFCGQHWISRNFTFQKDCERFKGITSRGSRLFLSFFLLSLYLAIFHFLHVYFSSRCARGRLLLKGERAKKIASKRSAHTRAHLQPDARYISLATIDMLACHTQHTYIHTYACRCIYRNKPAALQSFNRSGPRLAHFLYAFVASSVWDGHRESSTYNMHFHSMKIIRYPYMYNKCFIHFMYSSN